MNRQKLQGILRRGLIFVLLVTAGLLLAETGYFGRLHGAGGEGAEHTETAEGSQTQKPIGVLQPLAAVVCGADGGRFGAAYDGETVAGVFRRFSADLGEALGSAGASEAMTEAEFQLRLQCPGVFFDFYCPQPLELLSDWLGTEMSSAAAACRVVQLCLCTVGEVTELCCRTAEGDYFRCATGVPASSLRGRTGEYLPNGAYYSFESELLAGGDGFTVILDAPRSAAGVSSAAVLPGAADTNVLMQLLGMNSYVANSYTEADGTTVFVDEEAVLRLGMDGSMFFRRSNVPEIGERTGLTGAVDSAWQIVEGSVGRSCGAAELLFAGAETDDTGKTCTVVLDYAVSGIPVRLISGHAAEIILRGDRVIQAKLAFRRFALTEKSIAVLPNLQAAAIAAAERAAPKLIYAETGDALDCVWVKS